MKNFRIYILIIYSIVFQFQSVAQEQLTLQKAIEIGLQNNFSISIQKNSAEISKNNNTLGNAGFLPDVSASVSQNNTINNSTQEFYSGDIRERNNAQSHNLNAGINVEIPLFDGLKMFINREQLKIFKSIGQFQLEEEINNTVSEIINRYFAVVQLNRWIDAEHKTLNLSRERKAIAEAKMKIGSGSKLSLFQATVDLNTDSAALIAQLSELAIAKSGLNILLSRDPETDFTPIDELTFLQNLTFGKLYENLQSQNPGLMLLRRKTEIAALDIKTVKSEWMPTIGAVGGYSYSKLNSQTGLLKSSRTYGPSYGITASINLFNGLNSQRKLKNARLNYESQEYVLSDAELSAKNNLYNSWIRFSSNLSLVDLENSNVEIARQNLGFALEMYRLGTISDIELRDIQLKLTNSETRLITARYLTKIAETELLRLSGLLLKM